MLGKLRKGNKLRRGGGGYKLYWTVQVVHSVGEAGGKKLKWDQKGTRKRSSIRHQGLRKGLTVKIYLVRVTDEIRQGGGEGRGEKT